MSHSNNNPMANQVSVFHFTNRISSAKIRKYTIATKRGMGPGGEKAGSVLQVFPTPAPQVAPAGTMQLQLTSASPSGMPAPDARSPSAASSSTNQLPPAKKLKLKLNGPRRSDESPDSVASDTIAVGRSSRESDSLRVRYSQEMALDDPSLRVSYSDDSSELSEASSMPGTPPGVAGSPKANEYENMLNFYIEDDGSSDEKAKFKAIKKKSTSPKAAAKVAPPVRQAPQQPPKIATQVQPPPQVQQPVQQIEFDNYGMHRQHPPPENIHQPRQTRQPRSQNQPAAARLLPPPPPPPQVQLIGFDFVSKSNGPKQPVTVEEMIKRLETLSAALTNFGGVPSAPKSPGSAKKPEEKQEGKTGKKRKREADNPLDNFLGMFEDESSESDKDEEEPPGEKREERLDYILTQGGESDGPLTYGIQFIQNALRSWAQQRLQHSYTARHQQVLFAYQQQQQQKRGPGRPRKFVEGDEDNQPQPPPQPVLVPICAETQPEGLAVKAFHLVLDSGCLQMNAVLPQGLTRALRHLYMQIDHLINQGVKSEPAWRCMSYNAQIAANKTRVEKFKEAQAKAQEEMARQQHLAQQQVMQQMGLPVNQPQQMTPAQTQQQHQMGLERRRSLQQPYLSQHHLNPLLLGSQPPGTPAGHAAILSNPNKTGCPSKQSETPNVSTPVTPNGGEHMSKVRIYQNGVSKEVQAMKFSVAPFNPQAAQVFGPGAFPGAQTQGPNCSNRGPMSAPPTPVLQSNGDTQAADLVPAVARAMEKTQANGEPGKDADKRDSSVEMTDARPASAGMQDGSFTAVNSKTRGRQGNHSDTSAYPHPGAVVIDK